MPPTPGAIPSDPTLTWILAAALLALVSGDILLIRTLITDFRKAIADLTTATAANTTALCEVRDALRAKQTCRFDDHAGTAIEEAARRALNLKPSG